MVDVAGLAERIGRHRKSLHETERKIRELQDKIALLNRRLRQLGDHRSAMLRSIDEAAAKIAAEEARSRGVPDQGPDDGPDPVGSEQSGGDQPA